jgi:hypothetical protein
MASDANETLRYAASGGDVAEIERLIAAGADPNVFEGMQGYLVTPLQRTAANGHVAAIAALLKAGARVDGADSDGITPLMLAARDGHIAAVDALVTAGADVHRAKSNGSTALHLASLNSQLDAARALLEAGARTDVRRKEGSQPIDLVRVPARLLVAAARSRHASAPPHCHAQVCMFRSKSNEAPLRSLLAAAAPWSRRRPVAIACYGGEWEWEA